MTPDEKAQDDESMAALGEVERALAKLFALQVARMGERDAKVVVGVWHSCLAMLQFEVDHANTPYFRLACFLSRPREDRVLLFVVEDGTPNLAPKIDPGKTN